VDSADATDPTLRREKADRIEPADPMLRMDPAEPMLRIEPVEPMLRIEPVEPMLRIDPADPIESGAWSRAGIALLSQRTLRRTTGPPAAPQVTGDAARAGSSYATVIVRQIICVLPFC
jgi:hypothetical protein